VFTETKSRLGWRTGASRFAMKEQLQLLQSFDPAERAQAGQQLVELGLTRCAEPLLDHVANEFDNRVLAAVAGAVVQAPAEAKESRKAKELREWATAELERSALEEAFMGGEPDAVAFPPEPDFQSAGLEPVREPLPVRVPVGAVDAIEAAAEPAPIEHRFEVPEPEAPPIEYRAAEIEHHPTEQPAEPPAPEPIEYRFEVPEPEAPPIEYPAAEIDHNPTEQPAEPPASEPIEYRFEGPAPVAGYQVEAYEPEEPRYISWRPPADDLMSGSPFANGAAADNGNGHDPVAWAELASDLPAPTLDAELIEIDPEPEPAPALEAELVEVDPDPEPEATEYGFETSEPVHYRDESPSIADLPADVPADSCQEYRFEAPEPGDTEEVRFEAPEPGEPAPEPTNAEPRTLAERLRARDA
jgi:hypothetical protein